MASMSIQEFRGRIRDNYEELSKRLRQVAKYTLDNPTDIALETIVVIAKRAEVQPSTIVRFAQAFGFAGASEMQRLFRDELLASQSAPAYRERIRRFNQTATHAGGQCALDVLSEYAAGGILALQHLREDVIGGDLDDAIRLLNRAQIVYLAGFRRSFPVVSYMAYSLLKLGKRVLFFDGIAGLTSEQAESISDDDVLVVVSYHPYAQETLDILAIAHSNGAPVIAISDSEVSPVFGGAAVSFRVKDAEIHGFRSLTASMCLAQSLVIAYAQNLRSETGLVEPRVSG